MKKSNNDIYNFILFSFHIYTYLFIVIGTKSTPPINLTIKLQRRNRRRYLFLTVLRWNGQSANQPGLLSDTVNLEPRYAAKDTLPNSVSIAIRKPARHIVKWFPGNIGFFALMRTCSFETAFLRQTMAVGIGVGDQRRIQSRFDLIRSNGEIKLGYIAKLVRHDYVDRGHRKKNSLVHFYEFYDFVESNTDILTSQRALLKLDAKNNKFWKFITFASILFLFLCVV